ncbi:MAG TPA: LemA family protein [Candidatus Olsenella pullistercoris]|uniref:LemA family protein n=1 Tax=Candidatus Olsenella pullistercoris TaxID=2838712 RepID=A0A9D2EY49_9ACTN|nr:LemA family protein [Candidatus Olsenella pullistercoris]
MGWVIPVIIVAVIAIVVVWVISIYNGIVTADNKCDNAWQTIDAQLQRRNDLIPNLVETVRGYAKHESATLEAVTEARAAVIEAPTPEAKMEASNALTDTLKTLFAVAESYPDLKANTNFQQLQADLTDTENRISYARMSFNDMVLEYNNAIETFPGSVVAGSRFKPRTGFEVTSPEAREAPKVQF